MWVHVTLSKMSSYNFYLCVVSTLRERWTSTTAPSLSPGCCSCLWRSSAGKELSSWMLEWYVSQNTKRLYVVCASVEQSQSLGLPLGEMSFYPVNFKWNENIHFEWTFLVVMCQFFENSLKIIANNIAWDYVDLCSKRLSICGSDGTATLCFSRKSWEFPAPLPCLITW